MGQHLNEQLTSLPDLNTPWCGLDMLRWFTIKNDNALVRMVPSCLDKLAKVQGLGKYPQGRQALPSDSKWFLIDINYWSAKTIIWDTSSNLSQTLRLETAIWTAICSPLSSQWFSSRLSKYLDRKWSWIWQNGAREARQTSKAMNNNEATSCAKAKNSPCAASKGGKNKEMASKWKDFRSKCFCKSDEVEIDVDWSSLLSISIAISPAERSIGHKNSKYRRFCSSKMYLILGDGWFEWILLFIQYLCSMLTRNNIIYIYHICWT